MARVVAGVSLNVVFVIEFFMILEQLQITPAIVRIAFTSGQDRFDDR